jgi:hypothetical protein
MNQRDQHLHDARLDDVAHAPPNRFARRRMHVEAAELEIGYGRQFDRVGRRSWLCGEFHRESGIDRSANRSRRGIHGADGAI